MKLKHAKVFHPCKPIGDGIVVGCLVFIRLRFNNSEVVCKCKINLSTKQKGFYNPCKEKYKLLQVFQQKPCCMSAVKQAYICASLNPFQWDSYFLVVVVIVIVLQASILLKPSNRERLEYIMKNLSFSNTMIRKPIQHNS